MKKITTIILLSLALFSCKKTEPPAPDLTSREALNMQLYLDAGFKIQTDMLTGEASDAVGIDQKTCDVWNTGKYVQPNWLLWVTQSQYDQYELKGAPANKISIDLYLKKGFKVLPGHWISDGDHEPYIVDLMAAAIWNDNEANTKDVFIYLNK